MAQKQAAKKPMQKKSAAGFTAEERAAMKERARELKASQDREESLRDLLAKIDEMPAPDRALAKKIHAIVTATAPELSPRTWYGMPAYTRDGKVVCFFKSADKFNSRYATFGFEEAAHLDDGSMWPTSYALKKLTDADAAKIKALVKKAAG